MRLWGRTDQGCHVADPSDSGIEPEAAAAVDRRLEALGPDRGRPANVIATRGLSMRFGDHTILTGIDMLFSRGTITAQISPTGSGKSTFLRTLNRMNDKVSGFCYGGDVLLDDESIWAPHQDLLTLRRRVGMLFQRPNPFLMSIRDNIVVGVKAHRIAKGKQLVAARILVARTQRHAESRR